jgi:hypothetical protein
VRPGEHFLYKLSLSPDFLPRIAGDSRVRSFRYGKQHEARQRHQPQQEIRVRRDSFCFAL